MDWIEEFEQKLNSGEIQTDSQIEDFIDDKIGDDDLFGTFADAVWKLYYQWRARGTRCEGCKHAGCWGIYPCNECSRKIQLFDHFEK